MLEIKKEDLEGNWRVKGASNTTKLFFRDNKITIPDTEVFDKEYYLTDNQAHTKFIKIEGSNLKVEIWMLGQDFPKSMDVKIDEVKFELEKLG
jgi:hypothetical protein